MSPRSSAPELTGARKQQSSDPRESQLVLDHGNCKCSDERLRALLKFYGSLDRPPDVCALQDPPPTLPWTVRRPWRVLYQTDRALHEDDHPKIREKNPEEKDRQAIPVHGVCYLVHESVAAESIHVEFHQGDNKRLSATLLMAIPAVGILRIHNVYNRMKTINIQQLMNDTTKYGRDILVGDFNLHHSDWGGDDVKDPIPQARELSEQLKAAHMKQVTPRGVITFTRSPTSQPTTIDLTFISEGISQRRRDWKILDVPGFESDHRIIEMTLDIAPIRDTRTRRDWKGVKEKEFNKAVGENMEAIGTPDITTTDEIDEYAGKTGYALLSVTGRLVPEISYPAFPRRQRPEDASIQALQKQERSALEMLRQSNNPKWERYWEKLRKERQRMERSAGKTSWRYFTAKQAKNSRSTYRLARQAKSMFQPRDPPHLPDLKVGDAVYRTKEDKARCLRDSTWSQTSDGKSAPELPRPTLDRKRRQHKSVQSVSEGEVLELLRQLPKRKAAGPDKIANEALKMARYVLARYLAHLFNACLKLHYHPAGFKHAITVILRKLGKDTYGSPRSWRPIALLSAIGKLLEKIIANRLKDLALKHNLLPDTQFGLPGKCTTTALQFLLDPVYQAWTGKKVPIRRVKKRWKKWVLKKMKATLVGLDIKGAFDHVDRTELLKALIEKGVPDWLVLFTWSFLSSRSTILRMPGSTSDPFWVDIGIPQGSPMSPILFLFFAAPILESIREDMFEGATIYAFAYIDDTYLLAVSDDYSTNCEALEVAHEAIMSWATRVGITFSPEKYNVMHFKKPWSREPDCTLMPNIPGMSGKVKDSMVILGVEVDRQLRWYAHFEKIKAKVERELRYLGRTSGSIWGPCLKTMKRLYVTKIRPIITYACGAWFMSNPSGKMRWGLTQKLLASLESLQYQSLLKIAGAMKGTSRHMLEKELNIDSIAVTLNRIATVQRATAIAKAICTEKRGQEPRTLSDRVEDCPSEESSPDHPYAVLGHFAKDLASRAKQLIEDENDLKGKHKIDAKKDWSEPEIRAKTISACAQADAFKKSSSLWEDYCGKYVTRHNTYMPAIYEDWGGESFAYYAGLTRAQSTILLQCRTGVIGLNDNLSSRKRADSPFCPCGKDRHTARHLFTRCENLQSERDSLRRAIGHTDFRTLVTTEAEAATTWAINHFGIDHYDVHYFTFTSLLFSSCYVDPSNFSIQPNLALTLNFILISARSSEFHSFPALIQQLTLQLEVFHAAKHLLHPYAVDILFLVSDGGEVDFGDHIIEAITQLRGCSKSFEVEETATLYFDNDRLEPLPCVIGNDVVVKVVAWVGKDFSSHCHFDGVGVDDDD
ncbi:hypothetical protein FDECE_11418 [Fusarium decemcellulare]|nr:hypothetical protein FDECE_11418 [Fusarium decemcellulare]